MYIGVYKHVFVSKSVRRDRASSQLRRGFLCLFFEFSGVFLVARLSKIKTVDFELLVPFPCNFSGGIIERKSSNLE